MLFCDVGILEIPPLNSPLVTPRCPSRSDLLSLGLIRLVLHIVWGTGCLCVWVHLGKRALKEAVSRDGRGGPAAGGQADPRGHNCERRAPGCPSSWGPCLYRPHNRVNCCCRCDRRPRNLSGGLLSSHAGSSPRPLCPVVAEGRPCSPGPAWDPLWREDLAGVRWEVLVSRVDPRA